MIIYGNVKAYFFPLLILITTALPLFLATMLLALCQ